MQGKTMQQQCICVSFISSASLNVCCDFIETAQGEDWFHNSLLSTFTGSVCDSFWIV